MEGTNLNYQFSIFGDFRDISPKKSETVMELLMLYKDKNFIPSIFQEIQMGPIPNSPENRIMLINSDGWQINIGNTRVDITISYKESSKYSSMSIEETKDEACDIIKKLLEKYNKKCNRLALNTLFICSPEYSAKIEKKYLDKGRANDFYNINISQEWNERISSPIVVPDFYNEVINVGMNTIKGQGHYVTENKTVQFNGITLQIDINTLPNEQTYRFDYEKINKFFNTAISYKYELEKGI